MSEAVVVRLQPSQKWFLEAAAEDAGLSESDLVREAIEQFFARSEAGGRRYPRTPGPDERARAGGQPQGPGSGPGR